MGITVANQPSFQAAGRAAHQAGTGQYWQGQQHRADQLGLARDQMGMQAGLQMAGLNLRAYEGQQNRMFSAYQQQQGQHFELGRMALGQEFAREQQQAQFQQQKELMTDRFGQLQQIEQQQSQQWLDSQKEMFDYRLTRGQKMEQDRLNQAMAKVDQQTHWSPEQRQYAKDQLTAQQMGIQPIPVPKEPMPGSEAEMQADLQRRVQQHQPSGMWFAQEPDGSWRPLAAKKEEDPAVLKQKYLADAGKHFFDAYKTNVGAMQTEFGGPPDFQRAAREAMHITKMFYPDFEPPDGFEEGFAQQPTAPPQAPPAPGGQSDGGQPQSPQEIQANRMAHLGQMQQHFVDDPEAIAAIEMLKALEEKYGAGGMIPEEAYREHKRATEILKQRASR